MAYILPDQPMTSTPVTEEECVRYGGHCFEGVGMVLANGHRPERCKHCRKGRLAVPQEPYIYRDWP